MSNENRFKQTMMVLATTYEKTLTPEQIKIYWSVLGKYDPDHLHKAAMEYIESGEWFPKPAHLTAIIKRYKERDRQHQEIIKASHRIEKAPPTDEQRQMVRDMIKELKA